jgi:hypothetical protein
MYGKCKIILLDQLLFLSLRNLNVMKEAHKKPDLRFLNHNFLLEPELSHILEPD